uniref:Uncharacterized protein n=1 Tax=Medicago truncatula TaxID=3880 RepID=I3SFI6_MEDTR|nr:unknown [Medicago truncatula]
MQFAPADAATSMVEGPKPPSTSMSSDGYFFLSIRTLSIISGINFCPPNPGSTVMTRTISTGFSASTRG